MIGIENSHPEWATESGELLIGVARQIRAWQELQKPGISDAQMVRRFPALGSDKTYRKLREGNLDSLNPDAHLPKYRGVWAAIEALAGAAAAEEIYQDLAPALDTATAAAGLIPQRGKRRLLLIEGPSGAGKTESLRLIAGRFSGIVALIEAHEGWASPACALRDILLAVDRRQKREDLPTSTADLLGAVISALGSGQHVLAIDEGHHMTARVLNVLKTIINQTSAHIIVAAIGTLWRKLAARSWEEARQLIHNRLFERVILHPPSPSDARLFMERRIANLNGGDWKRAVDGICARAKTSGHFAYLRDLCDRANENSGEPTAADLIRWADEVRATRETR